MSLFALPQGNTSDPPIMISADATGKLVVPQSELLFNASFERSGQDLILVNEGAADLRVPGYFLTETPVDLFDPGGAVIRGAQVALMAGPIAPGQYAEIGAEAGANPIGQVEKLDGVATVQRSDGTIEDLQIGMKVFQQDVLQTEEGASLSVTFADGTIFTLASGSRMVIDELIYDPDSSENSGGFSLIQGSFVFIAGQVAKTGGMEVSTPSSTMGIRGTTVVVEVSSQNGVVTSEITLAQDIDGQTGMIELRDSDGNLIANVDETDTKWVVTALDGGIREVARTAQDELADSVLIAEAFAAFRAAASRVDAGETFVNLGDPTPALPADPQSPSDGDLEVDSIDEENLLAPPEAPLDVPEPDSLVPLEEGLNLPIEEIEEEPTIIRVAGEEDATEESSIMGTTAIEEFAGLTFDLDGGPSRGSVVLDADGGFSFVPEPDFFGTDSFSFTASSEDGVVGSGTVIVTVLPVNDAPVASDTAATVLEDGILSGVVDVVDVDGDTLSYTVSGLPSSGEVLLLPSGAYTYTPDPDFEGTDSFTVTVTDPDGETALSTISVTVIGDDDAPVVVTTEGEAATALSEADTPDIVGGTLVASDPDSTDTLTWSGSTGGVYGAFAVTAAGVWTYTLDPAAADTLIEGEVVTETFTATVSDDDGAMDTIDVVITLTGTNDAPRITSSPADASGSLEEGAELTTTGGTLSAVDPDAGHSVSWSGTSDAKYGVFTLTAAGVWTYTLDNALADTLTEGEIVAETFEAVASDGVGGTTVQTIAVAVAGTNDRPVVTAFQSLDAVENTPLSGVFTATDIDGAPGELVFTLGPDLPENGTMALNPDGTFVFTPDTGFVGIEVFQYQVTDAAGAVSTATARFIVESDPDSTEDRNVSLGLSLDATEDSAAGAVEIGVRESTTTSVNVAIALDRSGSIGSEPWTELLAAVQTSVINLSDMFEGSDTQVDVQIITFATDVDATPIYDLHDPALIAAIDPATLAYVGGATAWDLALEQTAEFFFSEPSDELSFLLFVTDGIASSGRWTEPRDALLDPTDDFDISIEAFGYGPLFREGRLDSLDDDPVTFTEPAQLIDAFAETPVFNPALIGFTVEAEFDGEAAVLLADETADGLIVEGTNFELPLATIEDIAFMLGAANRINITAQFDLNNDLSDAEVTLFSSDVIGKLEGAQVKSGLAGADLLFGSDEADTLNGAAGDDVLIAYGGDDTLTGGAGADTILAGSGDDLINIEAAPEAGDLVDGGEGRDVLAFEAVGEINAMLATLDISGIEALDIDNGAADALSLDIDELIGFSDSADTDLQELLDEALPNTRSLLGDTGDTLELDGQGTYSVETLGTVTDGDGNDLTVYAFSIGEGSALAALGVDTDIAVTTNNFVA